MLEPFHTAVINGQPLRFYPSLDQSTAYGRVPWVSADDLLSLLGSTPEEHRALRDHFDFGEDGLDRAATRAGTPLDPRTWAARQDGEVFWTLRAMRLMCDALDRQHPDREPLAAAVLDAWESATGRAVEAGLIPPMAVEPPSVTRH